MKRVIITALLLAAASGYAIPAAEKLVLGDGPYYSATSASLLVECDLSGDVATHCHLKAGRNLDDVMTEVLRILRRKP